MRNFNRDNKLYNRLAGVWKVREFNYLKQIKRK